MKGYSSSKATWGQIWFCCTFHEGPQWKPEPSLYCVFDVDVHSPCPQAGAEGSRLRGSVPPRSSTPSAPSWGGCTQTACPAHPTTHLTQLARALPGMGYPRTSAPAAYSAPAPSSALTQECTCSQDTAMQNHCRDLRGKS